MTSARNNDGPGPAKASFLAGLVVLAIGTCGVPAQRSMASPGQTGCRTVADFYRSAPAANLWTSSGRLTAKGRTLRGFLAERRVQAGSSERQLSDALVGWAQTLTSSAASGVLYVDAAVRPTPPCPSALLEAAARAPDLLAHLNRLEAPNALAQALRPPGRSASDRDLALARIVGAPARAVVVDTGSALLWTLENGQVVDTMKVVVGKLGMQTPQMAGRIQFATLNPYWNVPPDIVRSRFATQAIKRGASSLPQQGYQVVDRYGSGARPLDPRTINWGDVASGKRKVGVRQLPGPANMMGTVKFIFPNDLGIYLHDTPGRWAFDRADRRLSSGCVRVERAGDLYRWMFGGDLSSTGARQAEQRVPLAQPVPVYLFSFTPGGGVALLRATGQPPSASAISAT